MNAKIPHVQMTSKPHHIKLQLTRNLCPQVTSTEEKYYTAYKAIIYVVHGNIGWIDFDTWSISGSVLFSVWQYVSL